MADDIEDDADDGSDITEQEYADARARYAALYAATPPHEREPELFGRAVTGNGVMGDTLFGSDDDGGGEKPDGPSST